MKHIITQNNTKIYEKPKLKNLNISTVLNNINETLSFDKQKIFNLEPLKNFDYSQILNDSFYLKKDLKNKNMIKSKSQTNIITNQNIKLNKIKAFNNNENLGFQFTNNFGGDNNMNFGNNNFNYDDVENPYEVGGNNNLNKDEYGFEFNQNQHTGEVKPPDDPSINILSPINKNNDFPTLNSVLKVNNNIQNPFGDNNNNNNFNFDDYGRNTNVNSTNKSKEDWDF